MTACLDSWAVIAWLKSESPAADEVGAVIARERPVISWINVAEVRYHVERAIGDRHATQVVNKLRSLLDCELPTERRIIEASRIKAAHPIALADCFAISTAADNGAVLFTGDPEIVGIEGLPCDVRDLRG